MSDPPVTGWEGEGVLRELMRPAAGLGREDFDREVLARLRRL